MEHQTLTAMLAPAFFLTATASLLISANARLARIVDHARQLVHDAVSLQDPQARTRLVLEVSFQKRRGAIMMRTAQLLYVAMGCFVCTSLAVAAGSVWTGLSEGIPILLAALGVIAILCASILLSRETMLAVIAMNDELDRA